MRAQKNGRDIFLAFEEDVGAALAKVCESDNDSDAIHLAHAAKNFRNQMFGEAKSFTGFSLGCQEESVPSLLLTLVTMILGGPSIIDQSVDRIRAALSIAQLFKFNSTKRKRDNVSCAHVKHSVTQETPVPRYIGLMLHANSRKRELIDRLNHLGLCISYDRVLRLSAQMGNSVCELFQRENVVCPPSLHGRMFTTSAVDNIDHNSGSTTSKESFHGTGISLFQHPTFEGEGVDRNIVLAKESENGGCRSVMSLPSFYTDVPLVATSIKYSSAPATTVNSLLRSGFKKHADQECLWLDHTRQTLENSTETLGKISWAAYHASHQRPVVHAICPSALLLLFPESGHTAAMIKHSLCIVKSATEHLNPGQTPVITFDQPLYALAKKIQWKWPEVYGEDKFVVMMGGLHIEMATLKTLGDWLKEVAGFKL